ncbi:MAG: hypothetical protein F6J97_23860, partial [Leptolyngbya sp. SIO4C1]|nr:hypothetical protein [Leptolyngbya sp. SIO4C1]
LTVSLIDQAAEQLSPNQPPNAFYVWRYKGTDELLFLGDSESAVQSFLTAADWAEQSSHPNKELIAERSRQTAQSLQRNPASKRAQINAWSSILVNALNDSIRQRAVREIERLGGTVKLQNSGAISIEYPAES